MFYKGYVHKYHKWTAEWSNKQFWNAVHIHTYIHYIERFLALLDYSQKHGMDFQALFSKTIWYECVQLLRILKQSEYCIVQMCYIQIMQGKVDRCIIY